MSSLARHLQHHVSANPGLPWHKPVVEGTFIHIDDLLAFLDELSHLECHQLLILRNLQLHCLLAAILVLRLAAGDFVAAVEVAEGGVVDLHSEPLLYLECAVDEGEGSPLFQCLGAEQVLLHLLGDACCPSTLSFLPHHLEAIILPQADDGELGVDLHSSDLEDLAECAEGRFNQFTQSAIAQSNHEGLHLQRVMHHELGCPPLRWPLWVVWVLRRMQSLQEGNH